MIFLIISLSLFAEVTSYPNSTFNTNGFISVHRRIFEGVFKHAGEIRKYDITKKEWVLRGDCTLLNWEDIRRAVIMIFSRNMSSVIKAFLMKKKLNIFAGLFPDCGRFILSMREIHELRLSLLFSIYVPSAIK